MDGVDIDSSGSPGQSSATVFLVVSQGYSVRYMLRTQILKTLVEAGLQVVILSPNGEDADFKATFEKNCEPSRQGGVRTEKLETGKYESYLNGSKVQKLMRTIRLFVLNGDYDTRTADNYFTAFRQRAEKTGRPSPWKARLFAPVIALLKSSRILRGVFLGFEDRFFIPAFHERLFEKYKPALVVVTSLGNLDFDRYIMREGRRHGAKVASVILGMDNTSTKGFAGSKTDHVVAWTENMRRELIELHDMSPEKISVGGVAHFDYYFNDGSLWDKDTFCSHMGLDPAKKTIFFATKSPNSCPWSTEVIELVAGAIEQNYFGVPCQLLVRPHPIHWRQRGGKFVFKEILDGYEYLRNKYPFVVFNDPKFDSKNISFDLDQSEFFILKSTLTHSDLMINMFSTLNIEASIFDLPAINICYNGENRDADNPLHNLFFDLEETHNQRVISSGGVKTIFSKDELLGAIGEYLKDPALDSGGRDKLRKAECGANQGRSGRAIAEQLIGILNKQ